MNRISYQKQSREILIFEHFVLKSEVKILVKNYKDKMRRHKSKANYRMVRSNIVRVVV